MPTQLLAKSLRTHRQRLGLSREDVAFLLGYGSKKVSRAQNLTHRPDLATVFALEIMVGVPARQLFAGVYLSTERKLARRIEALLGQLASAPATPRQRRRVVALNAILGSITGYKA